MKVAIIPARGGSKRIAKKNIKSFCGQSIIGWPLGVARRSNLFDKIIVSTDDSEIADIAKSFGAEVPFVRSAELSDDLSTVSDVMGHTVEWMINQGWRLESVCCIYATAVFLNKNDLSYAFKKFMSYKWNYVFSATTFAHPIQRAIKRSNSKGIMMFDPKEYRTRSQDLEVAYHDAAQFYFGKPDAWLTKTRIFNEGSEMVVLPRWRVQDIDTSEDWDNAEMIFRLINKISFKN
jgi:pseudaminic acid cytidylyltransferase